MSEKLYQLIMQRGPQIGQIFTLLTLSSVIGRDPMADIVISDPEVSRQHVRLTRSEDGYQIQDLGSTNGTFVNGQRLAGESLLLQAGQEILLGSSIVLLYLESVGEPEDLLGVPPLQKTTDLDASPSMSAFAAQNDSADEDDLPAVSFPTIEESLSSQQPLDIFTPTPVTDPFLDKEPADKPLMAAPPPPRAASPLVADGASSRDEKRKRTITGVIIALLLILICCCAFFLSAWYVWGDPLMRSLGVY